MADEKRCLRVLVTGAAGLIGSELCGRLAESGHGVVALLHRSSELVRNDGSLIKPADYVGSTVEEGAIVRVSGDVSKTRLGLSPEAASALARNIDLIVHCAAETRFASPAELHRRVNVDGTANVLAFAQRTKGSPLGLVHVSTAYVSGDRSGPIAEDVPDAPRTFANPYEESKAAAEALIGPSPVQAAIARPSIVVGRSDTGAIGRFENIYAFLRLIGSGRITALPAARGATLDLVPIDHVIGGLTDIVEHFDAAAGRVFHLVSPEPSPLTDIVGFGYPGFEVPRLLPADQFEPSMLDSAESWLYESVASHFSPYLLRDPRFIAENLRTLSGRVCPVTGPGFLRRVVDYAAAAGYLRSNGGGAKPSPTI